MYLGVKAVIVKSFARIHRQNLINFGILPLKFAKSEDYDKISQMDDISVKIDKLKDGEATLICGSETIKLVHDMSEREVQTCLMGGRLNSIK